MTLRTVGWSGALALCAVLLAALAWGTIHAAAPSRSLLGGKAPELAVRTFDGRTIDVRGQRTPVVLNFWASWCAPCQQEQAVLNREADRQRGKVAFIGVDIKDSDTAARQYLGSVPVVYDSGVAVRGLDSYGVSAPPETYFIDGRGRIVAEFKGALDDANLALYLSRIT